MNTKNQILKLMLDGMDKKLSRVEFQTSSVGNQLGELLSLHYHNLGEMDKLRERIRRIEERLNLVDC